ncbi:MAG: hypothetical protein AB7L13_15950 [Acidimicrobiia bacterium]
MLLKRSLMAVAVVAAMFVAGGSGARPVGAAVAIPPVGTSDFGEFTPLSPARILDTRSGNGGRSTALGPRTTYDVQVTGRGGVPGSGVSSVVVNVTVTAPSEASFVSVFPAGGTRPATSTVNVTPNRTVPNLAIAKIGAGGKVSVYNDSGNAHVILDVVGWFGNSSALGQAARLKTLSPVRLLDTRNSGSIGANSSIAVQVAGRVGVPSNAVGVIANITATGATAGTYITAYPNDVATPTASNINIGPGETIPNLAMVRLAADGQMRLYNFAGNTHVIVDVVGYFVRDYSSAAGEVYPVTPERILDTRPLGPLGSGVAGSVQIPVSGVGGIIANITVTNPTQSSYFTVYPEAAAPPTASNLNFGPGQTVANLVVVPLPSSGVVYGYNFAGQMNLIVDVVAVVS